MLPTSPIHQSRVSILTFHSSLISLNIHGELWIVYDWHIECALGRISKRDVVALVIQGDWSRGERGGDNRARGASPWLHWGRRDRRQGEACAREGEEEEDEAWEGKHRGVERIWAFRLQEGWWLKKLRIVLVVWFGDAGAHEKVIVA